MNEDEIFKRLTAIEIALTRLTATLQEREKSCADRHGVLDGVCVTTRELKGAWKLIAGISALVGAAAGQFAGHFLK
ncbi:MAG: hypothetical protein P4N59_09575 [Negativicutes bacterium]|nr:hypothetical protein [Negativicutes bacterium]